MFESCDWSISSQSTSLVRSIWYARLHQMVPSTVVALNRAVAVLTPVQVQALERTNDALYALRIGSASTPTSRRRPRCNPGAHFDVAGHVRSLVVCRRRRRFAAVREQPVV